MPLETLREIYTNYTMHRIEPCCLVHRIVVVVDIIVVVVARVTGSLEIAVEEVDLLLLVIVGEKGSVLATLSWGRDTVRRCSGRTRSST